MRRVIAFTLEADSRQLAASSGRPLFGSVWAPNAAQSLSDDILLAELYAAVDIGDYVPKEKIKT